MAHKAGGCADVEGKIGDSRGAARCALPSDRGKLTDTTLPVEQPMKFEFIVNLKAAKQIGLTVPPNVLVRADRVIR